MVTDVKEDAYHSSTCRRYWTQAYSVLEPQFPRGDQDQIYVFVMKFGRRFSLELRYSHIIMVTSLHYPRSV